MPHALALFLHLVGVLALFVGMGTLTFAVLAVRRAVSVGEVRAILAPLTRGRRVGFETIGVIDVLVVVGVLFPAVAGAYLVWRTDNFSADWIRVATAAFLLIAPLGPAIVNPKLHGIMNSASGSPEMPVDGPLLASIHSRALLVALSVIHANLLAIVYLMTTKPPLAPSVLTVTVALVIGLLVGLTASRR